MKKNIIILLVSLGLSLAAALFLLLDDAGMFAPGRMVWLHKDREVKSRLLSIPILLYHNIGGTGPFSIDASVLREHFQLFRDRGIRVISLRELVRRLENPAPFDDRVIVITFDDGYGSMHSKLLPLVREFGYPVTLFVYADIMSVQSRRNLTWEKARMLDRQGIDIQAHSISHADLTELYRKNDQESRRRLFEELYLARRLIGLRLNKKIDFYAFPYGRYNLAIMDMARMSGYRRVFSTDYGSNIISRDNFCLRRQHIKSSYTIDFIDSLVR